MKTYNEKDNQYSFAFNESDISCQLEEMNSKNKFWISTTTPQNNLIGDKPSSILRFTSLFLAYAGLKIKIKD